MFETANQFKPKKETKHEILKKTQLSQSFWYPQSPKPKMQLLNLAGPTRREWGKFHPQYTNVKVEGPSFPTKGQLGTRKESHQVLVKGKPCGKFFGECEVSEGVPAIWWAELNKCSRGEGWGNPSRIVHLF